MRRGYQISLTGQQPALRLLRSAGFGTDAATARAEGKGPQVVRYRGLSGIDRTILIQNLHWPATRNARVMTEQRWLGGD